MLYHLNSILYIGQLACGQLYVQAAGQRKESHRHDSYCMVGRVADEEQISRRIIDERIGLVETCRSTDAIGKPSIASRTPR